MKEGYYIMPKGNKEAYKNSKLGDKMYQDIEPGYVSNIMRQAIELNNWPKIDIDSNEEVDKRINEYWMFCAENDTRPSVAGLGLALGVTRKTIHAWRTEASRAGSGRSNLIKKAMSILEFLWEEYMQSGKINPASGCFLGKNNFDYHDENKVVLEAQTGPQPTLSPDEIASKIAADIPAEIEDKGTAPGAPTDKFLLEVQQDFAEQENRSAFSISGSGETVNSL